MWEVFKPGNGGTIFQTRWKVVAIFLAWLIEGDYAKEGEGWL
jgi:hypothetical protein